MERILLSDMSHESLLSIERVVWLIPLCPFDYLIDRSKIVMQQRRRRRRRRRFACRYIRNCVWRLAEFFSYLPSPCYFLCFTPARYGKTVEIFREQGFP